MSATLTLSRPVAAPAPFRMRRDLQVQPRGRESSRHWLVKDPLSLRYFHLTDEEYFLLSELNGQQSLEELREKFELRFAPRRVRMSQLQAHLAYLHESSLVTSDLPGHAHRLLGLQVKNRKRELKSSIRNVLAVRLPGFDPEPLLNALYPVCRWMFSGVAVAAGVLLMIAAAALVAVQADTLVERLPQFREFFALANIATILLVVAATKMLHELAHALAAKHFGCECHEMGVMLLLFAPCLYCNVTDSWTLPSKWQRIAVSAAGMYAELVLAAACTFIWWFSEPGLLNTLCLNQMFVSSVGTLFFNANPLLRYDGYFILSDLIEVPNLQADSQRALQASVAKHVFGIEWMPGELPRIRHYNWLVAYAAAAMLYRVVLVCIVVWFYLKILEPYQLQILAQALTVMIVFGVFVMPAVRTAKQMRELTANRRVKWFRTIVVLAAASGLILAALWVPLPHRISAMAAIQPKDGSAVYVSVPGTLQSTTAAGAIVQAGDTLAVLENIDLLTERERLTSAVREEQKHLESMERQRFVDPAVELQMPAVAERLKDLESQLEQSRAEFDRLTIKSPAAGTILPPLPQNSPASSQELPDWSGTPLDEENLGAYLDRGTLFCTIGDPNRVEAVLLIDQADVEFVAPGQSVTILTGTSEQPIRGVITEMAEENLQTIPARLAQQLKLPVRTADQNSARPIDAIYLARVTLEETDSRLVIGASGEAAISVAPLPLATRIRRYLERTFRVRM